MELKGDMEGVEVSRRVSAETFFTQIQMGVLRHDIAETQGRANSRQ